MTLGDFMRCASDEALGATIAALVAASIGMDATEKTLEPLVKIYTKHMKDPVPESVLSMVWKNGTTI